MKAQKIHENFRRFVNEIKRPKTSDLCAIHRTEGTSHEITIYKDNGLRQHNFNSFHYTRKVTTVAQIVIGSSQKTGSGPCIPDTHEIAQIWVNKNYRGQGWQRALMDIAFGLADSEGVGLTSDHKHGTTADAMGGWEKIEKNKNYTKKKTKRGNDTFDYNDSTPDPDDDCSTGGKEKVATDHSFIAKYPNLMGSSLDTMKSNHKTTLRRIEYRPGAPSPEEFEREVARKATLSFQDDYRMRNRK